MQPRSSAADSGLPAATSKAVRWCRPSAPTSRPRASAWKLPLPAYSGSTPIIWGDTIFLNVATGTNTGDLELWAIDRNKQSVKWKRPARRRQPHAAQAEHVDAVADHRRQVRVGDDRRRHPQGVRLRRQGDLVARHPGGLRTVRLELGLRQHAAAEGRCALRAGAARHEDRRSVVHPQDRQADRQDDLARRAPESGGQRIAGRLHHAGLDRSQRPRRIDHHRRRRRVGPRSGDRQGILARRRAQSRSATAPIASSRRRPSSTT